MPKKFKVFWKKSKYDSIQEPLPHHTILCLNCGYLYNRIKVAKICPYCDIPFKKNIKSEFYVGKKKIYYDKKLEKYRKTLR